MHRVMKLRKEISTSVTNLCLLPADPGVILPMGLCCPKALSTLNHSYPPFVERISQSNVTHLERASL